MCIKHPHRILENTLFAALCIVDFLTFLIPVYKNARRINYRLLWQTKTLSPQNTQKHFLREDLILLRITALVHISVFFFILQPPPFKSSRRQDHLDYELYLKGMESAQRERQAKKKAKMCICSALSIWAANHKGFWLVEESYRFKHMLLTRIVIFSNLGVIKEPPCEAPNLLVGGQREFWRCYCQWRIRPLCWLQRLNWDFHAKIICPLSHRQSPCPSTHLSLTFQ